MSCEEEIWRQYDAAEQRLTAPLSDRMLELAGIGPGMRVLDLATGRGEPAICAAHRVGPAGTVVGVDISGDMLQMARERADREGVSNLELYEQDIHSLDGLSNCQFDAALARWCLMYLNKPLEAISAARSVMVTGGILVAAVMAEPERVQYDAFPRMILQKYATLPPIDSNVPGTFYYSDIDKLHRDFAAAGFSVEYTEDHVIPVMEARDGAEVVNWTCAFGMNRLLESLPMSIRLAWEEDLARSSESLRVDGFIRLVTTSRIVVARSSDMQFRKDV